MITLDNISASMRSYRVYSDTPSAVKVSERVVVEGNEFELSDHTVVAIPCGFRWDESSVPYLLRWAFPKSGKYAYSALVHDALYYLNYRCQKWADREFLNWMEVTGISYFQMWFRYYTVRLFGFLYWQKNIHRPSERCLYNRKILFTYKNSENEKQKDKYHRDYRFSIARRLGSIAARN